MTKAPRDMKMAYRTASICGALPLLVGVSTYFLWLATDWDWLMMAGMVTLGGGCVVVAVGARELVRFCRIGLHTTGLPRHRIWLPAVVCAVLLFSNFVVAGGIVAAAAFLGPLYTVIVHNETAQPLDSVRVVGGGRDVSFGSVEAGGSARRSFWIRQDGELEFRAWTGSTSDTLTIDGYVTQDMGGHKTVTVRSDGTVSAE